MNTTSRKRRLQFHAIQTHGFHYVWIDDETGMYLAGFNDLEQARAYGNLNGWEVSESSPASRKEN